VGSQGDVVIATDDRYQLVQDVSLTTPAPGVLSNDVDPDGDKLALSVVKDVAHGKLELNHDGSFLYAPAEHFTGSDGFTYRVKDSDGNEATAEVAIVVRPAEKPPPETTATTLPGPVAPPPPPVPPPDIEIKTAAPPQKQALPAPSAPVVPITVPRIAPPAPPTVALLPAEKKKGSGLPVKPLAAAGGGGLALAGLVAGLRS